MTKTTIIVFLSACVVAIGIVAGLALGHQGNNLTPTVKKLTNEVATLREQAAHFQKQALTLQNAERSVTQQVAQAQEAAKAAKDARLGVCYDFTPGYTDNNGNWVQSSLYMNSPEDNNGVYDCPNGETFASVVPSSTP